MTIIRRLKEVINNGKTESIRVPNKKNFSEQELYIIPFFFKNTHYYLGTFGLGPWCGQLLSAPARLSGQPHSLKENKLVRNAKYL